MTRYGFSVTWYSVPGSICTFEEIGDTLLVQTKPMQDPRSTGRRRARKVLYENYVPYVCVDCECTSGVRPKDAPEWFEEIWPIREKMELGLVVWSTLQADHEDKDVTNNVIENVNWRCASCHKIHDSQTEKGVSTRAIVSEYDQMFL
jgi:hypothetical protein